MMAFVIFALHAGALPTFDGEISNAIVDVQDVFIVPQSLVRAIIHVESGFNPRAVSRAGAIGLMQVMPFNAAKVGLLESDLWSPRLNILAGVRLLAVLLRYYQGDVINALTAYNAGPRRALAPIPQNGETPAYVQRVLQRYSELVVSSSTAVPPFTRRIK